VDLKSLVYIQDPEMPIENQPIKGRSQSKLSSSISNHIDLEMQAEKHDHQVHIHTYIHTNLNGVVTWSCKFSGPSMVSLVYKITMAAVAGSRVQAHA
jgi:hypothetical protein